MSFGERLKHWIRRHYSSQKIFAEIVGVTRQTLTNYITGVSFPKEEFLKKLSDLGCNVNFLLTGSGDIYADNQAGDKLRNMQFDDDLIININNGKKKTRDVSFRQKIENFDGDEDEPVDNKEVNERLDYLEQTLLEIKKIMQQKTTSYPVAAGRKK